MTRTADDSPDRHLYLPRLEAVALTLSRLPDEWREDPDVRRVQDKLTTAVQVLKDLN